MADAACSAQPDTVNGPDVNAEVERMIRGNWRVTVDEAIGQFKISHGVVHHIIHEVLHFPKFSPRWVSKQPPHPTPIYSRVKTALEYMSVNVVVLQSKICIALNSTFFFSHF